VSLSFLTGKYAAFIWPAYGVSILGITAAMAIVWHLYRRAAARLREFERSPSQKQP
jgi:heme exporter protein D